MRYTPCRKIIAATAFALCTTLASTAQVTPPPPPPAPARAPKPPAKIQNFEDVQRELQQAQAELARTLKDLKVPLPAPPDKAELEKMIAEIKSATAEAALEQHSAEVQKEVAASLKHAQEALAHLKDSKELQEQMKEIQQKMQQELTQAGVKMAEAAAEMRQFEDFVNSLAADGLIQKEAYRIEESGGKLLIDGKEQPAAVYEKYRAFLKERQGIKITKDKDGLQVRKN